MADNVSLFMIVYPIVPFLMTLLESEPFFNDSLFLVPLLRPEHQNMYPYMGSCFCLLGQTHSWESLLTLNKDKDQDKTTQETTNKWSYSLILVGLALLGLGLWSLVFGL
jgi:hypothetical protein